MDKAAPVTQRSVAKLEESAANIYFIRTCPVFSDRLTGWGLLAQAGFFLLAAFIYFACISLKSCNKYVKKDKRSSFAELHPQWKSQHKAALPFLAMPNSNSSNYMSIDR